MVGFLYEKLFLFQIIASSADVQSYFLKPSHSLFVAQCQHHATQIKRYIPNLAHICCITKLICKGTVFFITIKILCLKNHPKIWKYRK
jgi:hypothetical protein